MRTIAIISTAMFVGLVLAFRHPGTLEIGDRMLAANAIVLIVTQILIGLIAIVAVSVMVNRWARPRIKGASTKTARRWLYGLRASANVAMIVIVFGSVFFLTSTRLVWQNEGTVQTGDATYHLSCDVFTGIWSAYNWPEHGCLLLACDGLFDMSCEVVDEVFSVDNTEVSMQIVDNSIVIETIYDPHIYEIGADSRTD